MSNKNTDLRRYKIAALIGTLLTAVGSFAACLSTDPFIAPAGNVVLVIGIAVSAWGFTTYQP